MAEKMKLEKFKEILGTMTLDEKDEFMNHIVAAGKMLRERHEANGGEWLFAMVYDDVLSAIHLASCYASEAWFRQYKQERGM